MHGKRKQDGISDFMRKRETDSDEVPGRAPLGRCWKLLTAPLHSSGSECLYDATNEQNGRLDRATNLQILDVWLEERHPLASPSALGLKVRTYASVCHVVGPRNLQQADLPHLQQF